MEIFKLHKLEFTLLENADMLESDEVMPFGIYALDMNSFRKGYYIVELAEVWSDFGGFPDSEFDTVVRDDEFVGDSVLFTGDGSDLVSLTFDRPMSEISMGDGIDFVELEGNFDDIVHLGDGFADAALGGHGADIIFGGAGMDVIKGQQGNDELHGGADDDWIHAGNGTDYVFGGSGDDWIDAGFGDDVLKGGAGRDTLIGSGGDDRLVAGHGGDWLKGGSGDDVLFFVSDAGIPTHKIGDIDSLEADRLWDDRAEGGDGADRFVFKYGMGATEEIMRKWADEDGVIDWSMVMMENSNPHDHWVDWGGLDLIEDFVRADGDVIVLRGHTVGVHSIEYFDDDNDGVMDGSYIHVISDQAAFMPQPGMPMAHNGDYLGRIEVRGDLIELDDIKIDGSGMFSEIQTLADAGIL